MTPEPVSVGTVGLGGIAAHHADLVGGVDSDETACGEFTAEWAVPTHERGEPLPDAAEAIFVTTPNKYHEEYATAAVAAGCDALIEKPLAHTLDSAKRIAAAADAEGAV